MTVPTWKYSEAQCSSSSRQCKNPRFQQIVILQSICIVLRYGQIACWNKISTLETKRQAQSIPGDKERHQGSKQPRGSAKKKSKGGTVSHCRADSRKVDTERQTHDHEQEGNSQVPDLPILDSKQETCPLSDVLALVSRCMGISLHSSNSEGSFLVGQPACRTFGKVWENVDSPNGHGDSQRPFYEEKPSEALLDGQQGGIATNLHAA